MTRVSTRYYVHLMLQPEKLFVERAVWECIQELVAYVLENDDSIENEEALVATAMHILEDRGYAIPGKDKDGNLTFESTPQLLSKTGKSPGPLLWFASCRIKPLSSIKSLAKNERYTPRPARARRHKQRSHR